MKKDSTLPFFSVQFIWAADWPFPHVRPHLLKLNDPRCQNAHTHLFPAACTIHTDWRLTPQFHWGCYVVIFLLLVWSCWEMNCMMLTWNIITSNRIEAAETVTVAEQVFLIECPVSWNCSAHRRLPTSAMCLFRWMMSTLRTWAMMTLWGFWEKLFPKLGEKAMQCNL